MTLNLTDEERLHYQVMQCCLNAIQKEKPLVLKGGTALMLGYGLQRFSEDLDFDIADTYTGKGTIKLDSVLKNALPYGVSLQELALRKDTPSVTRYILHYQHQNINDSLKIEVSYRTPVKAADIVHKNSNQFLSIAKIADFKLNAVLDSHSDARTKARDLFDTAFIVKNYANEVNPELLNKLKQVDINELLSRYEQSFVEDKIMQRHGISADEVVLSLVDNLNNIQTRIDEKLLKQLCQPDFALRKAALQHPEISQSLLERIAIHHKCPQTRKAAAAVLQQRGIEIPTSNKPNTVPSKTVNKDKGIEI